MPELEFTQVIQETSKKDLVLLLIFSFMIMISSICITGMPLLFVQPRVLCKDQQNNYYECQQKEACETEYKIDLVNGIKSITSEFDLICNKRYLRSFAEQIMLLGEVFVCIIFSFVQVHQRARRYIIIFTFIFAAINVIVIQYIHDFYQICICLFLLGAFLQTYMLNVYRYISHDFKGGIKMLAPSFINTFWGFSVFIFCVIVYTTQDWRISLIYQVAIPGIILSFIFFIVSKMKAQCKISDQIVLKDLIPKKYDYKVIRNNKILFAIIFGFVNTSFYASTLGIDTIYGAFGILETISYFVSAILIKYFKIFNLLKHCLNMIILIQLCFVFQTQTDHNSDFKVYLFISLSLLQRFIAELIFNFQLTYLPFIVDGPSEQKTWSYSNLVYYIIFKLCLSLFMILPYYIEFMRGINISPIFGLTILIMIPRILLNYTQVIDQNKSSIKISLQNSESQIQEIFIDKQDKQE